MIKQGGIYKFVDSNSYIVIVNIVNYIYYSGRKICCIGKEQNYGSKH